MTSPNCEGTISPDYMIDAKGNHIRMENVKDIDKLRDQLVYGLIPEFKLARHSLVTLKKRAFEDIAAFVELAVERYGAKVGGDKGNVRLISFDGRYKIERSMNDYLSFDEGLIAAKALINECLTEWTEGSRPEIRSIVDRAFRHDRDGNVSIGAILQLRRLEINDDRWNRAMQAIGDSLQVVESKAYFRAYEKNAAGGWDAISLDIAKV